VSCRQLYFILILMLSLAALVAARCPAAESVPPDLAAAAARQPQSEGNGALESAGRGCRVERKEFFSRACSSTMAYYAFVPAENKEGARYPVLYLLHGAFDDYTAWKEHAGNSICQLVSKYRLIIVTPEGLSFGWYANSRLVRKNQVETYFMEELIPDVEINFPTNRLRGIAGLSMGGHGAFFLCLRHPGVFSSVSSMSGILDITRHRKQWKLAELFGPYEGAYAADWDEHSVLRLLERAQSYICSLPMLITVSQSDPCAIDDNRAVHCQLEKMNVCHRYNESPGGHDWTYWTTQLPVHVSFHAQHLSEPTEN
jgi:S-formylglutathione hydrolase FrmB